MGSVIFYERGSFMDDIYLREYRYCVAVVRKSPHYLQINEAELTSVNKF